MHADLMIFETPHVLSSYSNVSLMRHDFLCTLLHWIRRFQLGKNIGFQVYANHCFYFLVGVSVGVEMIFKRSVIGKKFHISHKNFVTMFVCCEKFT